MGLNVLYTFTTSTLVTQTGDISETPVLLEDSKGF
jgi:hypothetical protein